MEARRQLGGESGLSPTMWVIKAIRFGSSHPHYPLSHLTGLNSNDLDSQLLPSSGEAQKFCFHISRNGPDHKETWKRFQCTRQPPPPREGFATAALWVTCIIEYLQCFQDAVMELLKYEDEQKGHVSEALASAFPSNLFTCTVVCPALRHGVSCAKTRGQRVLLLTETEQRWNETQGT